jgi:hypothetical protein
LQEGIVVEKDLPPRWKGIKSRMFLKESSSCKNNQTVR